jgi:signal peptidase I
MTNNSNTALIADILRQSMAVGQTPFLTISSDSMAPLLKTGDLVGLSPVEMNQLIIGDIITLVQDEHLLTHRFWGIDDQGRPFTRGDRPFTPDKPGEADQLLGRVIVRRRHDRELSLQMGAGHRLNRHLAWLVRVESYLLTGYAPSPSASPRPSKKQRTLFVRLVRRAFFTWASLVANTLG